MGLDWVQLIVLVPAVLTIIWAVVTFTVEWQARQRAEQKRLSALYVNPFLLACEELQSRLYNLLKGGGLGALRAQDPESKTFPQETLYLIAQYFGWERYNFRYGPYAQDRQVFRLTEAIRDTFATDKVRVPKDEDTGQRTPSNGRPFNFYRYQQKALAQIILESGEGPAGRQAETIPFVHFRDQCDDLAKSLPAVKDTLATLGKDGAPARIDPLARGRLAQVQRHLVALLTYLESKEEFSLFVGERRKCDPHPEWEEWTKEQLWCRTNADGEQSP